MIAVEAEIRYSSDFLRGQIVMKIKATKNAAHTGNRTAAFSSLQNPPASWERNESTLQSIVPKTCRVNEPVSAEVKAKLPNSTQPTTASAPTNFKAFRLP